MPFGWPVFLGACYVADQWLQDQRSLLLADTDGMIDRRE